MDKMPLHVPESLSQFRLYENIEEAERIFAEMDVSTNDPLYLEFMDAVKDDPDFAGNIAQWIKGTGKNHWKTIKTYIDRGREFDINVPKDKFISFNDYKNLVRAEEDREDREGEEKIQNDRTSIQNNEVPGTIENEKVAKDIKDDERSENQNIITFKKLKQNKIHTTYLSDGYYCSTKIRNSDAMNIPGQGLYIWAFGEDLLKSNTPLKFGQYGSNGRAKTPYDTIRGYHAGQFKGVVILDAIRWNDELAKKFPKSLDAEIKIQDEIKKKGYGFKGRDIVSDGEEDVFGVTSREVFGGISLEELQKIINEVLFGNPVLKNYPMRKEQDDAVKKMKDNYNKGSREFLLAAKMRFGKNFALLNTAKDLGFKNILVLTYKPHVFQSLKDDITGHVNFKGWEIGDFKDKNSNLGPATKFPKVFMSSAQLAQYRKSNSDDEETLDLEMKSISDLWTNLPRLKKIPWDMIIADEYHYGTSTSNFKEILKELTQETDPYIVYVSGTAMKDIAMGRFKDEQIFEWSYIDEQREKERELDGDTDSRQHIDMPTVSMHLIEIDQDIKDEVESDYDVEEGGEGFTMKKLIGTNKDGSLKYGGSLKKLLHQIMEGNQDMAPYQFTSDLDHTLWVLPKWTAGIKAMADLMGTMDEYRSQGYKILAATGNVVTDIEEVEEAINKYPKTITLTCARFKEGVSIPKWNGVFMLDDGRSVEEYLQAMFRCQTPNPEDNKEECYVFDFNPQRGLSMTYEICENDNKRKSGNVEATFRDFKKYAPILYHSNNSFREVNFKEVIEAFKTSTNWRERFSNVKNIDVSQIDENIINALSGIKPGKRGSKYEINDNDVEIGKNFAPNMRSGKGRKKLPKDKIKYALERLTTVLSNIPEYLFNTSHSEKNLDELLEYGDDRIFKKITGIELSEFENWVESGLVNPVFMNRNIWDFSEAEAELMADLSGQKLEDFTKKNFQMRAEEGKTPLPLVREMLDKLPKEIWKDKSKKFLDPCMGLGTFLLEIKDRLMENLDSVPLEDREEYIMNNMIYGIDIDESKYNMALKLLGTNEDNDHIINKDALEYKFNDERGNDMKFDVVVGNPPFQPEIKKTPGAKSAMGSGNKIWPKFVEKAFSVLKPDGIIAFITPHNWRSLGSDIGTHINARDLIWDNNIIEFHPANKYFDVGGNIKMDYWIVSKNPNLNGIKIPEIYRKIKYLPEIDNPLIAEFFEEVENGNNYKRDIRDHRYNKVNAILKSKSGDKDRKYPHINTLSQYDNGFLDWYPHKTEGFDDKKVMVSSVRSPKRRAIYDDGNLGCGHKCRAFTVGSKEDGNKLEKFINSSKIMELLERDGKSGFAVPIFRLDNIPKSWVERFNNGEDL